MATEGQMVVAPFGAPVAWTANLTLVNYAISHEPRQFTGNATAKTPTAQGLPRKWHTLWNNGSVDVFVAFGIAAADTITATANSLRIQPGQRFDFLAQPNESDQVAAFSGVGSGVSLFLWMSEPAIGT